MPLKSGYSRTLKTWGIYYKNGKGAVITGFPNKQSAEAELQKYNAPWTFKIVSKTITPEIQSNPRRPAARELNQARRLFRGFTGEKPQNVTRLKIKPFSTGLAIGKILAIIYEVSATGEKLKHSFKDSARPHLIVSSDGHQVLICGGKFTFTNRGFVDK